MDFYKLSWKKKNLLGKIRIHFEKVERRVNFQTAAMTAYVVVLFFPNLFMKILIGFEYSKRNECGKERDFIQSGSGGSNGSRPFNSPPSAHPVIVLDPENMINLCSGSVFSKFIY